MKVSTRLKNLKFAAALALGAASVVAPVGAFATNSPTSNHFTIAGPALRSMPAPTLPVGARVVGVMPGSDVLRFDLQLRMQNGAGFQRFLTAVTTKSSPLYRHYLGRGQFAQLYGASAAQILAVEKVVRSAGLQVTSLSGNHLFLSLRAPVSVVNHFFKTSMASVRLKDGSTGWMSSSAVRIPQSISGVVTGVVGINNVVHLHNNLQRATPRPGRGVTFPAVTKPASAPLAPSTCAASSGIITYLAGIGVGGVTDDQIAHAYGLDQLYGQGDYGQTQTVAIIELEPYLTSDIQAFDQCYFSTDNTSNISNISVDGGAGTGAGQGEAALDIEQISALAPAANIQVYSGPNTSYGAVDVYNQIVSNDTAQEVSSSWASCESAQSSQPGIMAAEHLIFEEAAAQGQTVFASSGDDGNDSCAAHASTPTSPILSVEDPASQPYVVGVGGTTALSVSAPNPTSQVWNDGALGGASGGGISNLWAQPAWMNSAFDTSNGTSCGASACRTVPDVSAIADEYTGVTIYYNGSWFTIGGTSEAAPSWAAMLAEINSSTTCTSIPSTGNGVGFAAPLLYQVASNPANYAQGFTDVTSGNNDVFGATNGVYAAGAGYDMATGLGTPNADLLAPLLCNAAQGSSGLTVTKVSPSTVSLSGGVPVTVTGTGFTTGGGVQNVYFGASAATSFSVVNDTTLIAVSPPAQSYAAAAGVVAATKGSYSEAVTVRVNNGALSASLPTGVTSVHFNLDTGAPVVTQVGPNGGPMSGGSVVRIVGSGFTGATKVTFGGVAASFTVSNDNMIEATSPAPTHARCARSVNRMAGLCQVQVVVTGASGLLSATAPILPPLTGQLSSNAFGLPATSAGCHCEGVQSLTEYDYSTVTLSGVVSYGTNQAQGSAQGGTTAQLFGTGINELVMNYVNWGDPTQQSSYDYSSSYFSPDGRYVLVSSLADPVTSSSPTSVPVSINSLSGNSNSVNWNYNPQPFVTSLSTAVLPSAGGQTVTIRGAGFTGAILVGLMNTVKLGVASPTTIYPSNFTVVNDTTITLTSPSLVPGGYAFVVCSADGICNESQDQASFPEADSVVVGYPGQELVTSVTDPLWDGGVATVDPSISDDLEVQGVNLDPNNDVVIFENATSGDIVAEGQFVALAIPTDVGANTAYLIGAPSIFPGAQFGPLDVYIYNPNTGQSTPLTATAVVNYF